jgi:hypothetical protein
MKSEATLDKKITLSVQQLLSYALFFITFGASVYTFFKAIPKIDKLDETVNQLQVSNTRVEERIVALKEVLEAKREISVTLKPEKSNQ